MEQIVQARTSKIVWIWYGILRSDVEKLHFDGAKLSCFIVAHLVIQIMSKRQLNVRCTQRLPDTLMPNCLQCKYVDFSPYIHA
jgi:hypothetical protein